MFNKFDQIFKKIIILQQLDTKELNSIIYQNMDIAIIPGAFKPPTKDDWNCILQYLKVAKDKVLVIISNNSKQVISNRPLSKTNLTRFSSILNDIEQNTDINIVDLKNNLTKTIDTFTYNNFIQQYNILYSKLDNYLDIQERLQKYKKSLQKTLFKSISKTDDGKIITADIAKQIFLIYANTYNVLNKVDFIISKYGSPVKDMIDIITTKCNNCNIYLGFTNQQNSIDNSLIDLLNKQMKENSIENIILADPIQNIKNISSEKIRFNINNLNRQWFPIKLTDNDFEKIQDLLTNN